MPQEKFLIHHYANLKKPSLEEMGNFFNIHVFPRMNIRYVTLKNNQPVKLFFSTKELDEAKKSVENDFIREQTFNKARIINKLDQEKIYQDIELKRGFLENCAKGDYFDIYLRFLFDEFSKKNYFTLVPQEDAPWIMRVDICDLVKAGGICLEDWIAAIGLMEPLMNGKAELRLPWTKKCAVCGDFYQAKGDKAAFCSGRCRAQARAIDKRQQKDTNMNTEK